MLKLYKYQGAGNDFLIADNRDGTIEFRDGMLYSSLSGKAKSVADICDRRYGVGADGLMLLENSGSYDFRMTYFNSDGSGGMMCGNGGRCIVAFAADMGLDHFDFEAADGFHTAEILKAEGNAKTVRLKMKDVSDICMYDSLSNVSVHSEGCFLDTGTRHFVSFVSGLEDYDVVSEGREIRYNAAELQPSGANVNYVEPYEGGIKVRTYEKGVEDETFACGTGIVASCISAYMKGIAPSSREGDRIRYEVKARRDMLAVDFRVSEFVEDVWLTGPAAFVAEILLCDL